ncbi:MAG: class I SAM-dependent methyltransferase [Coriobacteriia bacterium]
MDAESARRLFDTNSPTYDRVNGLISLGLDERWYAWAAEEALPAPGAHVLDAFAGTGAVGLRVAEKGGRVTLADVSPKMLEAASARAKERGLAVRTVLADLSAEPLAIEGAPFDAVVAMWGLRYVDEPARVVASLARLLEPGGRLVLVDFVEPPPVLASQIAALYFFHVLPRIAGLLAGHRELYGILAETARKTGPPRRLIEMAEAAGLRVAKTQSMGLGLVFGLVATRGD